MAAAFDAIANAAAATGSSFTMTITVPATNPVLLVGITLLSLTATVSSVSLDLGGTATEIKTARGVASYVSAWAIPAPPAGAGTVSVTLSASVPYQAVCATYTSALQTTPCPTADAVNGTTSAASTLTITPLRMSSRDVSFGIAANTVASTPTGITTNDRYKDATTTVMIQAGDSTGTTALVANWSDTLGDKAGVGLRIVSDDEPFGQILLGSWRRR